MASDLLTLFDSWRPDIVVRDMADYGGCIAAEARGIPHSSHESLAFRASRRSDVAEPLADLRTAYSLAPDPEAEMIERYLVLSQFPPSLDGSRDLVRPTRHSYRASSFDRSGDEGAPEWPLPLPGAPLVYATLGTAQNVRTDLLLAYIEALRDEPVNLVVTVGRDRDPAELGPQPANVRIERYIPQSLLFPRCDLMICHGGTNSVLGALAHGIPLVITPITADQPENADRCEAGGIARVVPLSEVSAASIREAASIVLSDPSYRQAAVRVRDEFDALPGIEYAVVLLEQLAREKAAIITAR